MKIYIEERVLEVSQFIIDTGSTIRQTAKQFGVSKSTVHKDIIERLPVINPIMTEQVNNVIMLNEDERHIRGGLSTKIKYSETN